MTTSQDADRAVHRDIRQYLEELHRRGLLRRVARPTNKDTEVMPLVRWQFRSLDSSQRTGWLFGRCSPRSATSPPPDSRRSGCRDRIPVSSDNGAGVNASRRAGNPARPGQQSRGGGHDRKYSRRGVGQKPGRVMVVCLTAQAGDRANALAAAIV